MDFRSGEAMMAFDADLCVLVWNDAAETLTGIPAEEAVGRRCWEILCATDDHGGVVCHTGCSFARLAREGWPIPTRRLLIKTSNGRRNVAVATVAVKGGERPIFLHLMRNGELVDEGSEAARAVKVPSLTPRQRQVLAFLADGVPAKVIATKLGLSETTVRNHIRGIFLELGCHSQLEAVAKARKIGALPSA